MSIKRSSIVELDASGRSVEGTCKGGNPVTIFGSYNNKIHGFYHTDECGWIPCQWNMDGTFLSSEYPRQLDIELI